MLLLIFYISGNAQPFSNYRHKTIRLSDSLKIDSLSIVPGTLSIKDTLNQTVSMDLFYFNEVSSVLKWKQPQAQPISLKLEYQVFAIDFSKAYPEQLPALMTDSVQHSPLLPANYFLPDIRQKTVQSGIQANGNITRGISVGNNQNMVVNSNLDMQLSGKLSENLQLEGVLSDKNIPLQPDGYNQQIREFDQVYIKLFNDKTQLQMGDVQIADKNSRFLKFKRKIQGGYFNTTFKEKSKAVAHRVEASAAIARGKLARNQFQGIEGVQGPYPLSGANNEKFIVVLAGTEKIYLDGILLERGENADYVINYNTAELIFSVKHMITKDSRIIAEFEYSDRSYNRYLTYAQGSVKSQKATFNLAWFSEGDAKSQPVNADLDAQHEKALTLAGDNQALAIIPGYDSVGFNKDHVRYEMRDTLVDGVLYDSVLVQSFNQQSAIYQAKFAVVGNNNGNYVLNNSNVNGKVFRWVAPEGGEMQGNYAPIQQLAMPQKKQLLMGNTAIQVTKNTSVAVEVAMSNYDANTFSDKNSKDNIGLAMNSQIKNTKKLGGRKLVSGLQYNFIHRNFNAIERFRSAEFHRDWNIVTLNGNEHLVGMQAAIVKKEKQEASIVSEVLKTLNYQGFKNNASIDTRIEKFTITSENSLLYSQSDEQETRFYRHRVMGSRPWGNLELGLQHAMEDNRRNVLDNDTLLTNSEKFSVSEMFLQTPDTLKRIYTASYKTRVDYLPVYKTFKKSVRTHDFGINTTLNAKQWSRLSASLKWRKLKVISDSMATRIKNEDNLLGRVDHQLNLFKRALTMNSFYEMGTGMETKKDFSYIQVAPGKGVYVWVDYNENDIPELNEFEVSPFPEEANYIRLYTPTNEYIKVYSIKMNETFHFDPSRIWRNEKGLKKFASKFNNRLSLRLQQKHTQSDIGSRLNPFQENLPDSLLLNNQQSFRNQLFFNRRNPTFGADWQYTQTQQKNLLLQGFDKNSIESHQLNVRWNITKAFMLTNKIRSGSKTYESDFFSNKNYDINFTENRFELRYQPGTTFRVSSFYVFKDKKNQLGGELLNLHEAGPELKISSPGKGTINGKCSFVHVKYQGTTQSTVGYEMMEGLLPGNNFRWSVNITRNLNEYLRLSINYLGRKMPDTEVVHTGQFSLSAVF